MAVGACGWWSGMEVTMAALLLAGPGCPLDNEAVDVDCRELGRIELTLVIV